MATKDTNNSGLLSKVAKFVRNPTTNWTDLDKQDPEPDNGYSKQALKEMIERKRQNDFVRRREFDQLRKLRNRDPSAGNPDLAGRPSYFQSSMPSNPGERASTIKKIDEIEAQMSNQWWQGKSDVAKPPGAGQVAPAQESATPAKPASPPPAPRADARISDISYAATKLAPMVPELPDSDGAAVSRQARVFWRSQWTGKTFMAVGAQDPVLGPPVMAQLQQTIQGCPGPLVLDQAGHFVQEHGEAIAHAALQHFDSPAARP
jgi:pimeloyl-ACP methyl ester carboxylesterase